jgi:L-lactate utilization protein LutC
MKIKDDFHHLIDTIEDEKLLKSYYQLIQTMNNELEGTLWNALSEKQKEELLLSYDESFDENNLISHEQVKLQHEKWLKP